MTESFLLAWSRLFVAMLVAASTFSAKAESTSLLKTLSPNLPLGDINVVILTDVHSWLGGHGRQETKYDADLGDVLSFWERLKEQCDDQDIFLVNNGDFVDGTGLSETMDGQNNPEFLIPLLEKMPYDAVNVGNHELYSKNNIEFMTRPGGYVDWWGDRYITSNIHKVPKDSTNSLADEAKEPLGNHYKILKGKNNNLLVFGFLYNMGDYARGAGIELEKVQTTVQQQWFLDALENEDYDGILVLAHMDLVDPLVDVVRKAIRDAVGDSTAVVFATGHTHYRGVKELEDLTITFEAGRYLDTVGFVSLPSKDTLAQQKNSSSVFGHKYLDASKKVLFQDTLGFENAEDGKTKDGQDFSDFIAHTRAKLELDKELGCAPMSYHVSTHIGTPGSMWGLYRDEVIPKIFTEEKVMKKFEQEVIHDDEDLPYAMLLPSGSWRYNLYNNAKITVDDIYAVAPFNDTVVHLGVFSAETILAVNKTMNHKKGALPSQILIGDLVHGDSTQKHHLYTHEFGSDNMKQALQRVAPDEPVEITKAGITSSLIWLAFAEKYWPCDGEIGKLPEWFSRYQQSNHKTLNSNIVNVEEEDCNDWAALVPMVMLAWVIYDTVQLKRRRRTTVQYKQIATGDREIPNGHS